jgi:hypothetical protein
VNFDNSSVATVVSLDGTSFVKRNGIEVPLREEMPLQLGDVIKSTENALVVISIPGTRQQIPAFVEVSGGAIASLGFNPDAGLDGQVVVSNTGEGMGNIVLVSEFDGENQAAVMEGQESSEGAMAGLFGAGLLGGSALAPVAGAVGAAALFAGLASGDDDNTQTPGAGSPPINNGDNPDNGGGTGPGTGGNAPGDGAAENASGLSRTVSDLTNNLRDLTAPVPVISDVVDAVGDVLDSVLVGDNNGGLGGILTGLGEGLTNGLDGTPLEPVGNVLDMVLGTLGGGLGMLADQVSNLGDNTPLDPLANLVGDILGRSGPNSDGGVGGVVGTLTNVTDGLAQLLQPVPLLGELTGALDNVVNSTATGDIGGGSDGGLGGGLGGVVAGLGQGLESGLSGTPLALLGEGADALLGTLGGALGGAGEQISSFGEGTPAEALTGLLGNLLGTDTGASNPFDFASVFTPSIASNANQGAGGLLGSLPLLDDLTRTLG